MASNARSNRTARSGTAAAWAARRAGTTAALLEVASDPHTSTEALCVLVPPHDQLGSLPTVVALAVLAHPRCPGGLADRLSRHPDPVVRLAVVHHPGIGAMAEAVLLADPDPAVRATATATAVFAGRDLDV